MLCLIDVQEMFQNMVFNNVLGTFGGDWLDACGLNVFIADSPFWVWLGLGCFPLIWEFLSGGDCTIYMRNVDHFYMQGRYG